ncbi:MAG: hypothetical protein PHC75_03235 [Burkholderiales bacterium]|nr:hypothetical protein [Burkholderiales bacterium]
MYPPNNSPLSPYYLQTSNDLFYEHEDAIETTWKNFNSEEETLHNICNADLVHRNKY